MNDSLEWLAGLMEGEGYFGTSTNNKTGRIDVRTAVFMNDEDIIRQRASQRRYRQRKKNQKV